MRLQRGSVLGVLVLCLVLVGTVDAQAQGNGNGNRGDHNGTSLDGGGSGGVPAQVAALQAQLNQALETIAQLQAALASEASTRQAEDAALRTSINAIAGGGVTQTVLDAAIAAEAAARSTADAALEGQIDNEAADRAAFDATLAPLTALAPLATYVTINTGTVNDLAGPHVIFTGANVHNRSGHWSSNSLTQNGRGNLVLGYNEPSGAAPAERGGSHNVVVGGYHRYNFGVGLIVGYASRLGGDAASVSGGFSNIAGGEFSSVSGGSRNEASGPFSSVTGGDNNIASGNTAAVSAGQMNHATGDLSSVSGGSSNTASGLLSTVGGGASQANATPSSFVP